MSDRGWAWMRLCIVVKTYPNPSVKYQETVCTAGVTEDGRWIRLYPVAFRYLAEEQQYRKFDWVRVKVRRHEEKDFRPESYRPDNDSLSVEGHLGTEHDWRERRRLLLPTASDSLEVLQAAYDRDRTSLGLFKPHSVDFEIVPETEEWAPEVKELFRQTSLFGPQPKPLEPLPVRFRYVFTCHDARCRGHDLSITDWEIAQSYRKWRHMYEAHILEQKIKETWLQEMFQRRDGYFIVGTRFPYRSFMIIGVFSPPRVDREQLMIWE